MLQEIGLEGQRIQMINLSSAMGAQFALSATELTEEIRQIGPNPLKNAEGELGNGAKDEFILESEGRATTGHPDNE